MGCQECCTCDLKYSFVNSHGKTYTNAFPLNSLKRWQSVGKASAKCWQSVGYLLEVLEKALEVLENQLEVFRKAILCRAIEEILFWKNPLGKFTQAVLGVESKQSFICSIVVGKH